MTEVLFTDDGSLYISIKKDAISISTMAFALLNLFCIVRCACETPAQHISVQDCTVLPPLEKRQSVRSDTPQQAAHIAQLPLPDGQSAQEDSQDLSVKPVCQDG